jgi:uncharacterized membrane protein
MDITNLFGLPAHPLLVHAPIVLIPLAALMILGLWWEPFRRRFGWATVAILGVSGIFTQLAISSGQTLRHTLDSDTALVKAHVAIAENIRPWLLLCFIALIAFLVIERRRREDGPVSMRSPLLVGTLAASVVFAGISVYWIQRIGHTGAKAVWKPKMDQVARDQASQTGGDQNGDGDSH